jgi:type I restriction enzyme S subunit
MALTKLGIYIKQSDIRNTDGRYGEEAVIGLSTQKSIIETKANLNGVSLTSYKLMPPEHFAYVPDTSRRGDKMSLAYNFSEKTYLVSSISVVFSVKKPEFLSAEFLFMYFNRPEFDRYSRFHSWGSARETFSWEEMCDIEINLPPLPIQQKYVDVYEAMLANQQSYERGLEDLKLVCDAFIDRLRRELPHQAIGPYIELSDKINDGLTYGMEDVRGVSIGKYFIDTKADMKGISLRPYSLVAPNEFAYVTVTSRNGEKISIACNDK